MVQAGGSNKFMSHIFLHTKSVILWTLDVKIGAWMCCSQRFLVDVSQECLLSSIIQREGIEVVFLHKTSTKDEKNRLDAVCFFDFFSG